jgi:hypothetical protein
MKPTLEIRLGWLAFWCMVGLGMWWAATRALVYFVIVTTGWLPYKHLGF